MTNHSNTLRTYRRWGLVVVALVIAAFVALVLAFEIHATEAADPATIQLISGTDGAGNPNILKDPAQANLWLCPEPEPWCDNKAGGVEEVNLNVHLNGAVTSPSPKYPDTIQTIGSFEFEVHYDAKLLTVDWEPGPLLQRPDVKCNKNRSEGILQIDCYIYGYPPDAPSGPGTLIVLRVRATPDVYSILIANQGNGITTQLINQDCKLYDSDGHPIKTGLCEDAAVTIRYLPTPTPAPTPTPTPVPDSDGDGVLDPDDACPGTAAGATVDANGCSDAQVDGDGDGICDPGAPSDGPSGCTGSDNCPAEDSTGFDADNDGCIDSVDNLGTFIETLFEEGAIDSTMRNSLYAKIDAAVASSTRDNVCAAVNQLDALKNQIEAQTGNKISQEAANLLLPFITNVQNYILFVTGVGSC